MFRGISGDRIGLAGGWEHVSGRGGGETCGLHMGSGTLYFLTNAVPREKGASTTPCARVEAGRPGKLVRRGLI